MLDLISVIIPIYKVEEYLDECIVSVISQTYKNLEIILVDDGSPDNCPAMCDDWANKDKRIRVIHKENGGVASARNAGLKVATGEFIAFIDSDDWVAVGMYEMLLSAIKEHNADIVSCGINVVHNGKYQVMNTPTIIGDSAEILKLVYADTVYPVSAFNKLYRRSLWQDLEFPNLSIGEDAVATCVLVSKAKKIVQIDEPLYFYRIHNNSAMTASFSIKRMDEEEAWRCNYLFIEKNHHELKKAAFDFYLQRVNVLIHTMTQEDRNNYVAQYQYLRMILKNNFRYVFFYSQLKWKQRIKLALYIIKL